MCYLRMGDHFVLLVDRLLTESTLEAAIESRNPSKQLVPAENDDVVIDCASHSDSEIGLSPRKVVECRICQDKDYDSKMETPCSCCGSLKREDSTFKVGKLSVEERKEKIHRYMKKRNERNFSKKIKVDTGTAVHRQQE